MDKTKQLQYLNRLMFEPYEGGGETKFFFFQFLQGSGNELLKKFWSKNSSSRMAFELYSPLVKDSEVKDFEFEYQLPALASGGTGPNMDVYIETEDEIIFVESKYTETADLRYITESYLSPGYYADIHGGKTLDERFRKYPYAEDFAKFCRKWQEIMDANESWKESSDWFEPKQETCHLSGILFYIFDPKRRALIEKKKKIRLCNVFWAMDGDRMSDMEQAFVKMANDLVRNIVNDNSAKYPFLNGLDFQMKAFSVQHLLENPKLLSEHIRTIELDDNVLLEFEDNVYNKTRKNFRSSH